MVAAAMSADEAGHAPGGSVRVPGAGANRNNGRAMPRRYLGVDVHRAAEARIRVIFDHFERILVAYSGGKDSTVMLDLVMREAKRRGRRVGIVFVDLEAQYQLTIAHVADCFERYAAHVEPFWISLPLSLRNAVSQFEPQWLAWDPEREDDWVRRPPANAITDEAHFPFFRRGMEFEEFVPAFAEWYGQGSPTASFVGIRTQESLNRWRTIASRTKTRFLGHSWTTWTSGMNINAYPIYDWRTEDIWTYTGRERLPYNRLYDYMHRAGLTIHQQRICQPYGDDQRRGLWLFHLVEPDTWGRVVARVQGANAGALYVRERGNIMGNIRVSLPPGHTWESFSDLLLNTMPPPTAEHYRNKVAVFLKWWQDRGYAYGIPDEGDPKDEAARRVPSWRRVCKALLRNDYWCKGLSFSQPQSAHTEKYLKLMRQRRRLWGIYS